MSTNENDVILKKRIQRLHDAQINETIWHRKGRNSGWNDMGPMASSTNLYGTEFWNRISGIPFPWNPSYDGELYLCRKCIDFSHDKIKIHMAGSRDACRE